jgi:prepilin-type processing-associated H-X9-DG protein/prepilin-type N-terminal cleavage/methylation domain-containing protein
MRRRTNHWLLRDSGFTLIELFVVTAVIAILAALLLPALIKGKASSKSAACKSNLRQLGLALNMYVNDYDKYPGNAALYSGDAFQGIWATGMNWLNPYLGGRYDADALNSQYYWADGRRTVFSCPAVKPRYHPGLLGGNGLSVYSFDYGYNELGTGWKNAVPRLGLGFTVNVTGLAAGGMGPLGPRTYVKPGDVRNPENLIAIGDGANWIAPNHPRGAVGQYQASSVFLPHGGGANIVFCDGHVEQAIGGKWIEESNSARSRWNNDGQPHPETW